MGFGQGGSILSLGRKIIFSVEMGLILLPFTYIAALPIKLVCMQPKHFFSWFDGDYQARSCSFNLVESQSKVIFYPRSLHKGVQRTKRLLIHRAVPVS